MRRPIISRGGQDPLSPNWQKAPTPSLTTSSMSLGVASILSYIGSSVAPVKCTGAHFRGTGSWHAAAAFGLLGGRFAHRLLGTPATKDEGAGLLLTARRAAQETSQQ